MKKLLALLVLVIFFVNSMIWEARAQSSDVEEARRSYTDYRELENYKLYKKVSDTAFAVSGYEDTHRVTQLQKNDTTLILFSEISLDNRRNQHYKLLDTLTISGVPEGQFVTIGYCYKEGLHEQQIIGIVEKTKGMHIKNLRRAWKANPETGTVVELEVLEGIDCLNQFSGE